MQQHRCGGRAGRAACLRGQPCTQAPPCTSLTCIGARFGSDTSCALACAQHAARSTRTEGSGGVGVGDELGVGGRGSSKDGQPYEAAQLHRLPVAMPGWGNWLCCPCPAGACTCDAWCTRGAGLAHTHTCICARSHSCTHSCTHTKGAQHKTDTSAHCTSFPLTPQPAAPPPHLTGMPWRTAVPRPAWTCASSSASRPSMPVPAWAVPSSGLYTSLSEWYRLRTWQVTAQQQACTRGQGWQADCMHAWSVLR